MKYAWVIGLFQTITYYVYKTSFIINFAYHKEIQKWVNAVVVLLLTNEKILLIHSGKSPLTLKSIAT